MANQANLTYIDPVAAVESILADVQKRKRAGDRDLRVYGYGFGTGACYAQRHQWPAHCRRIQDSLLGLGYSAKLCVEERQFVDIWLNVSWQE